MQKSDHVEYEKRIRIVQEWILEDWPSCDIVQQVNSKWGVEERQAKRYLAEARKRWVALEDHVLASKRKLKIESLKKLKRSLQAKFVGTPNGIQAILNVEKEIIKLEALAPPKKLEIYGKDGQPIQTESKNDIDYSKLSDEVLLAIMNAKKDA